MEPPIVPAAKAIPSIGNLSPDFSNSGSISHGKVNSVTLHEYKESVELTDESLSHLASDSPLLRYNDYNAPSKVDMLLGSGKVADILLWRDDKKSFFCFLLLVLLYHTFFISRRTFISSVANLLLLITVLLCGHHVLPLSIYGFRIQRLSSSFFEISDVDMRNYFLTMICMWNGLGRLTKSLAQGEDWLIFLKVSAFLYFCKLMVPISLNVVIGVALVLAFTLCFMYEQYEEEIDGVARVVLDNGTKVRFLFVRYIPHLASVSSHSKLTWAEK
ncbi:hypothetical protein ACJIZ3_018012 [Penstemon smallii]|uniref:Reticulon-like protein n=1 Tax=Penstemon smallii TaxID=265156 RepID=A0ABD3SXY3_9LAMI